MDTNDAVSLPSIPGHLRWQVSPQAWSVERGERLVITAGPHTDLFVNPQGTSVTLNSPRLLFRPDDDFILSARVAVAFGATFDAGVILLHVDDACWAKLCFEYSPRGEPMVVSVVTRGFSDDCNSAVVAGGEVYLRVARLGRAFAFHYSLDGSYWHLVRHFTLDAPERASLGFSAQSPVGAGCTATFSAIEYRRERLGDIRDGR